MTGPEKDPRPALGPRLKQLREALHLTAGEVCRRSVVAAQTLGGDPYLPLTTDQLSHVESEEGRNKLIKDAPRAVLCEVFGITRDDLANYLDGRLSVEQVLEARASGHKVSVEARAIRFGDAPEWRKLVVEARRMARAQLEPLELTDETFEELRKVAWVFGPVSAIDAVTVARWAIAIQQTKARINSGK